jgi:DNA ligase (NAD+)
MPEPEERIKELVGILNKAGQAYYSEDREIMSNREYDALYAELEELERKTGIILADSPTIHVGYEIRDSLPKETHEKPMLSLDKTKEVSVLSDFVGNHRTLLSWKMDGLTIVLTYRDGQLARAVTRGNGLVGEVVTPNAKVFRNVPLQIPFRGELILRGEAVIRYSDFNRINEEISDVDARYKNPRNLCSGSVRQLNSEITAKRNVCFFAFALVQADGVDFENSREKQFLWLQSQGFTTVGYKVVTADAVPGTVRWFSEEIVHNDFPSDGLVALYDDIAYGESLGVTAKFPRNAFAFKWKDETAQTILRRIEWSPSRTGLINPIAVFDPVELEGTTVRRASVHNVSILREMKLGIGDTITVYKANMIIPQIAEDLTKSGDLPIPDHCPVCGGKAMLVKEADLQEGGSEVLTLHCMNPECQAKKIRRFDLFVSRDALNIDGLSEASLEKFISAGFIHEFADIFRLPMHRQEITEMDGFGEQSYVNLEASLKKASKTVLTRLLFGLGIPNVGLANARLLSRAYHGDLGKLMAATAEELSGIDTIGPVIAKSVTDYFGEEKNRKSIESLLQVISLEKENEAAGDRLSGKTFVITGSLEHFANRKELQALIEGQGGRVTGSVSEKTSFLVNNDSLSGSAKNRTAQKLGIPIITENEFLEMIKDAD